MLGSDSAPKCVTSSTGTNGLRTETNSLNIALLRSSITPKFDGLLSSTENCAVTSTTDAFTDLRKNRGEHNANWTAKNLRLNHCNINSMTVNFPEVGLLGVDCRLKNRPTRGRHDKTALLPREFSSCVGKTTTNTFWMSFDKSKLTRIVERLAMDCLVEDWSAAVTHCGVSID